MGEKLSLNVLLKLHFPKMLGALLLLNPFALPTNDVLLISKP